MNSWYLLYCKRGQLERAVSHLELQSVVSFYPSFETEKIVRGKRTAIKEPLFPNYLFINFDHEKVHTTTIAATRGVSNFVRIGKAPVQVPTALIEELKNTKIDFIVNESLPNAGEKVIINAGIFKGLEAIYHEKDGEKRSILLVNMLGKEVPKTVSNRDFDKV